MFNPTDSSHFLQATPLLSLLAAGLFVMLLDAFKAYKFIPIVTILSLLFSAYMVYPVGNCGIDPVQKLYFGGMIAFGGFASIAHLFLCVAGFFSVFFIRDFLARRQFMRGEPYALLLFATIGMIMLANTNDLIIFFIGLEIMSVCLYVMAGLFQMDKGSNEAGLKYFLLGAFATGFLLFGIALLYGLSGSIEGSSHPTTKLNELQPLLSQLTANPLFYISAGMILVGFLFKVAAFPFHSWTPDVYTGAPTPMVGFMATGSKMAAFIALSLFVLKVFPGTTDKFIKIIAFASVASMIYGNIVAAKQTNIKRMLAFSSIAHTGYLLLALCSGTVGYKAIFFYMVIYTLMTVGAFGVISMVDTKPEDAELDSWRGLGIRRPLLGIAMSVFLFSLAGMPPLAGFMGKYYVFSAAILTHETYLLVLAIIGILTSVVGAFYYLKVMVYMYFREPLAEGAIVADTHITTPVWSLISTYILVALIVLFGVRPDLLVNIFTDLYNTALFLK